MISKGSRRQSLFLGAKIVVCLLIFWFLIHYSQLNLDLFSSVLYQPVEAFFIFVLFYASTLANSWRWHRLNSVQSIKLSFARSILPTYVGIAFNNIFPGSVGGDFVRCFYVVKKFPDRKSGAILSVLLDKVCGLMGVVIIACIVALFSLDAVSHNQNLYYLYITCASICGLSFVIFCLSIFLPERMGLSNLLKKRMHWHWLKSLISILEAINVYRKSKRIIFECLFVSVINQLILLSVILLINNMMGLSEISPFDYMLALAIAQIANLIPLTPGGVGIGEAAFANVILILNPGVIGAYATVFLAFRLLITMAYLPGIIVGIFGLNISTRKADRVHTY